MRPLLPRRRELAPYLDRIDGTRRYSNVGPLVQELERRVAEHLAVDSALVVACSSATAALEGALAQAPVDPGLEWELPSWTFTATAGAVIRSGRPSRFMDVDDGWRLVPSPGGACLVDVLPFGAAADLERLGSTRTCVVVDAAASFDALAGRGPRAGTPAAFAISLHATKALAAGEGGLLVSNDGEWARRFRQWVSFGMDGSRESSIPGTNAKLSEYSAAVALAAIDAWPATRSAWRAAMDRATSLSRAAGLRIAPALAHGDVSPYWIVECPTLADRHRLEARLAEDAIESRRWWGSGCHGMRAYAQVPRGGLERTERLSATTLGLPLSLDMTDADWSRIEGSLRAYASGP